MIFARNLILSAALAAMAFFFSDGAPSPGKNYFKKAGIHVHHIHSAYTAGNYAEAEAHARDFCGEYALSVYLPAVCRIGAESCRRQGKADSFFTSALSSFKGFGKKEALDAAPETAPLDGRAADKTVKKSALKKTQYIFLALPGVDAQMKYLLANNIVK
ncbi:hypothetical protein KJ633_08095, partial [bacterium]|nr:hypothetical protein [bacterium]